MNRTYLGDAVYAQFDDYGVLCLTTENGIAVTNRIILEPEIIQRLLFLLKEILYEPI